MPKYAINGRYIVRKLTGQERFARELVAELDRIVQNDDFVVVVPEYATEIPAYKNISVVRYGKIKSHLWEQISFYKYIKRNKLISVNLTTTCPFLSPDIVCIHDAAHYEISSLLSQNVYGKLSLLWHKLLIHSASKKAKIILTVSEYSKKRLSTIKNIPENKIFVLRNAWQHIERINCDESIFSNLPLDIKKGGFYLALSSLAPQKNFSWIIEVAKRNPSNQFIICGGLSGNFNLLVDKAIENLHFIGYVTDGQMKALMKNCKAFIHPAIYEGFGIPPLEALACGTQIIISTSTCLPEIYGKSAHYIDPYKYDYNLDEMLDEPVQDAQETLVKYNWAIEAKKLYNIVLTTNG